MIILDGKRMDGKAALHAELKEKLNLPDYYGGKKRGAERVLYSSDGLYYYTSDHYQTFTEMFPEELP